MHHKLQTKLMNAYSPDSCNLFVDALLEEHLENFLITYPVSYTFNLYKNKNKKTKTKKKKKKKNPFGYY